MGLRFIRRDQMAWKIVSLATLKIGISSSARSETQLNVRIMYFPITPYNHHEIHEKFNLQYTLSQWGTGIFESGLSQVNCLFHTFLALYIFEKWEITESLEDIEEEH